ncbi:hypothetical protein ACWDBD_34285 [Streptomyces sp. NPDC001118]
MQETANIVDSLPKSAQSAAKRATADIYNTEDRSVAWRIRAVEQELNRTA